MNPSADGLEAILHTDDPVERKLALKSKYLQPFHLKIALQDEDPEVREAAALHGNLNRELIHHVLLGDDPWLKSVVLSRKDLGPEELETALADPQTHEHLANHPALLPEQKERILSHPEVPEHVRAQLLAKNIGHVVYPLLGEGKTHHAGAYYPRDYDKFVSTMASGPTSQTETGSILYNAVARGMPAGLKPNEGFMALHARKLVNDGSNSAIHSSDQANKAMFANEHHEVQHGVFGRLAQRYGHQARAAIIDATLAKLPAEDRQHIAHLFSHKSHQYAPASHTEESITTLQNYLMDPIHRRKSHVMMGIHNQPELQKDSMKKARRAWEGLRRIASTMKPEDVGLEPKTDKDLAKAWTVRLEKSRKYDPACLEDHLGYDSRLEAICAGLRLITGKDVDREILRARLHDTDGDLLLAGLLATGLTEEDRPALEAVVKVRQLAKAADKDQKHTVVGLTASADEMAKGVQWAFDNNEAEPVHLGGKHSKGTFMCRDNDGNLLLIKPGSGKQSPALGAAEEGASQSRREAGFSAVAKAWGLGRYVPDAQLLQVDGKEVAVLKMLGLDWTGLHRAWQYDPGAPRRVLRKYLEEGMLHRWAVLDWVLGNPDRHGNNIMVGPEHDAALIDHGSAFAGPSFAPSHDSNSFVPYYLRVWGPSDKGWSRLSREEKGRALPTVADTIDGGIRHWVEQLDPIALGSILHRFGINPEPSLKRLQLVKLGVSNGSASAVINQLWLA